MSEKVACFVGVNIKWELGIVRFRGHGRRNERWKYSLLYIFDTPVSDLSPSLG